MTEILKDHDVLDANASVPQSDTGKEPILHVQQNFHEITFGNESSNLFHKMSSGKSLQSSKVADPISNLEMLDKMM